MVLHMKTTSDFFSDILSLAREAEETLSQDDYLLFCDHLKNAGANLQLSNLGLEKFLAREKETYDKWLKGMNERIETGHKKKGQK